MSAAKDRAVVEAVERLLARPGAITRAQVAAALATEPPVTDDDPIAPTVEENV